MRFCSVPNFVNSTAFADEAVPGILSWCLLVAVPMSRDFREAFEGSLKVSSALQVSVFQQGIPVPEATCSPQPRVEAWQTR